MNCVLNKNVRLCMALLIWSVLFGIVSGPALKVEANVGQILSRPLDSDFPKQFGEVVYQTPTETRSRIYIIANGHRSAINGAGNSDIVQAQIETFRIGEWLINQNRIELLLPEGFFGEWSGKKSVNAAGISPDNQLLREKLSDTSAFVNAELLLHRNFGIGLNQIEDRKLYRQVRDLLRASKTTSSLLSSGIYRELGYLQKLRTVNLLQRAPDIIAAIHKQGMIDSPNAMLTIGLAHLEDLIAFLESDEIKLAGLTTANQVFPAQNEKLNLRDRQVGITVIIPRSLIAHRS